LIAAGADVNAKTDDGKDTALRQATKCGQLKVVEILKKAGAKE
jgi:ankyrin repeat protein